VLGEIAKRVVNAGVLFLAAVTFFLVPLGKKTAEQHLVAVAGTSAASEAADAFADAGRKIVASVRSLAPGHEEPEEAELMPAD
jgi:hypothetical protein